LSTGGDAAARMARDLLERTRVEVDRADNKASIMLAGALAAAGGVSASLAAVGWSPLSAGVLVQVFWWPALFSGLGCIACLGSVLYPRARIAAPEKGTVGYFSDVVALDSLAALRQALGDPTAASFEAEVDQVWQVSHIVDRKYRLLRWAIRFLGASLVLLLGAAVAGVSTG
jgi:hypothetical protein